MLIGGRTSCSTVGIAIRLYRVRCHTQCRILRVDLIVSFSKIECLPIERGVSPMLHLERKSVGLR